METSEGECEGGDISETQLKIVHKGLSACRKDIQLFASSDSHIFQLLADELYLHRQLVKMFLTQRASGRMQIASH